MYAELLAVRRCMRGEGSDFGGGKRRAGGVPGEEDEEVDMVDPSLVAPVVVVSRKRGLASACYRQLVFALDGHAASEEN